MGSAKCPRFLAKIVGTGDGENLGHISLEIVDGENFKVPYILESKAVSLIYLKDVS